MNYKTFVVCRQFCGLPSTLKLLFREIVFFLKTFKLKLT